MNRSTSCAVLVIYKFQMYNNNNECQQKVLIGRFDVVDRRGRYQRMY